MSTGVSDRKERNSSIELLRIVSMLMIVFCHFATHGGFEFAPSELTLPRFWWNAIEAGGNLGTDVFVLISGYFLICDRRPYPDLRHVLKFWGQVFFYSTVIFAVFCLTGLAGFSAKGLVKALFPVSFGTWWFASAYFVLYLIHPFLNKLLAACDMRGFQFILLFLLTLWCVIPTFTTSYYQSNSLVWFVTLYAVGGYIRRFGLFEGSKPLQWLAAFLAVSLVRYLSAVVLILIGTRVPFAGENSLFFYGVQSVPTFLSAVTLFMTFEKIKMRGAGLINLAASASFGVYLIHDNPYVRHYIWQEVFKNSSCQSTALIIPYSIGVCLLVYAAATLADLLRQQTAERLFMLAADRVIPPVERAASRAFDRIRQAVFGKDA